VSPSISVVAMVALLTLCGLGALAVLGVARSPRELRRRSGLAPLAGMAWAGIAAATLATAGSRLGIVGLVALTIATCAGGAVRLARAPASAARVDSCPRRWLDTLIVVASLVLIAVVCAVALAALRVKPLVEYDGWAMWGMKARAIATLGSAHPDVFATPEAYERLHIEYPLLLPALNALPLQAADEFSSNALILSCLAVGLAGLLGLWALFRDRVRPVILLPTIAAIAATPAFFLQLGTGYADVPLAVFVACGIGAAARWVVDRDPSWLALATLFLSAGVLTKNEGLLFATAAFVSLLVVARGRRRAVAVAALVCAALFAPWRVFIAIHDLGAPDYDLSSSFDVPWVLGRLDRARVAADVLLYEARDPQKFGMLLAIGVAAVLLALVFAPRPLALLAIGFGVLSFAGLIWIYVLTPRDVRPFLEATADRVIVSFLLGLAALTPLLVEESVRGLASRNDEQTVGASR
jgi:Dolichyl-phosphate-mannose-protein mannosyltransferase